MKINKLIAIAIMASCVFSVNTAWGQWNFTATLRMSGNCYGVTPPSVSIPANGLSTKQECEALRQSILNINVTVEGCRIYYQCTPCTGSNIVINPLPNSNPQGQGNPTVLGTSTGQSFVSSDHTRETQDWIEQWQMQYDALNFQSNYMPFYGINPTGDKRFDQEWKNLVPRIFEPQSAPKMISTIDVEVQKRDAEWQERERIAALHPLDIEALELKKKAWEEMLEKYRGYHRDERHHSTGVLLESWLEDKIKIADMLIDGGGTELIDKGIEKNQQKHTTQSFENNIPWDKLSETIDNPQRLTTVMNQLAQLNSDKMPKYVDETSNAYHFKDGDTYFFVAKDGGKIDFAKQAIGETDAKLSHDFSVGKNTEVSTEFDGKKISSELSYEKTNLLAGALEEKKFDWSEFLGISGKAEITAYKLETATIHIDDKGGAWKIGETVAVGTVGAGGKLGLSGVEASAKLDIASADLAITYIQQPTIDISGGNLKIQQAEFSVKGGATAGVQVKANLTAKKVKAEVGGLVKAGVGYESHNTNKNINYLPEAIQKKVVSNLIEKIL